MAIKGMFRQGPVQLSTQRFYLKTLGRHEASDRYLSWVKDPEISRTLDVDSESQSLETLKEYIASHDGETKFLFGIFEKKGNQIGTHSVAVWPEERRAYIGVMIGDKDFWGKRVPLETRSRLLNWVFHEFPCDKVQACCDVINTPAIFNFQKQGWDLFKVEPAARMLEGRKIDRLHYQILKSQWKIKMNV